MAKCFNCDTEIGAGSKRQLDALALRDTLGGSPAHAGIDPIPSGTHASGPWFPRTRGDRPVHDSGNEKDKAVPPHTRG